MNSASVVPGRGTTKDLSLVPQVLIDGKIRRAEKPDHPLGHDKLSSPQGFSRGEDELVSSIRTNDEKEQVCTVNDSRTDTFGFASLPHQVLGRILWSINLNDRGVSALGQTCVSLRQHPPVTAIRLTSILHRVKQKPILDRVERDAFIDHMLDQIDTAPKAMKCSLYIDLIDLQKMIGCGTKYNFFILAADTLRNTSPRTREFQTNRLGRAFRTLSDFYRSKVYRTFIDSIYHEPQFISSQALETAAISTLRMVGRDEQRSAFSHLLSVARTKNESGARPLIRALARFIESVNYDWRNDVYNEFIGALRTAEDLRNKLSRSEIDALLEIPNAFSERQAPAVSKELCSMLRDVPAAKENDALLHAVNLLLRDASPYAKRSILVQCAPIFMSDKRLCAGNTGHEILHLASHIAPGQRRSLLPHLREWLDKKTFDDIRQDEQSDFSAASEADQLKLIARYASLRKYENSPKYRSVGFGYTSSKSMLDDE